MDTHQQFQCFLMGAYQCAKSKDLLMEADRVPSHSSHVANPRQPKWYHGSPLAVQTAVDALMAKPQAVRRKDGTIHFRKPRSDYRGLLACVASYPVAMEALPHLPKEELGVLRAWLSDVDEFVNKEFGEAYVGAVIHRDEAFPHIHLYAVGPLTQLHPGLRAELNDGCRIDDNQERMRRYKKALSDFLDRFHTEVSAKYGHARKGNRRPSPRIRDRKTWMVQKEAERVFRELGDVDAEARARNIFVSRDSR
jgi:Plasmid recombination enzyme